MQNILTNNPLVSVPVITYNSERTVIETLESIKAQTYPNIELIVSDDCSPDNTVELCREWIKQNGERFVRTEVITIEKNKGVSANFNRADNACVGEWVKPIAGDDVLLPNCIQDCVEYVSKYPETIYLFGRCSAFGAGEAYCQHIDSYFDYSFFDWTIKEQLHQLLYVGNCLPATTVFYNKKQSEQFGIKNDERIPLLEDWPKWINIIRSGIKLHFVDKILVKYRVGGITTQKRRVTLPFYRSERLMRFYYQYPEWCKENMNTAIERIVSEECNVYQMLLEAESEEQSAIHLERNKYEEQYKIYYERYNRVIHSKAYRLGNALLKPFRWLRK